MKDQSDRKKKATHKGPRPLGREMAQAEKIYGELLDLYRSILGEERTESGSKPLPFSFDPGGDGAAFARRLIDALEARAAARNESGPFVAGRVYCYHCESSSCDHARPTDHLSVFAGYAPTGQTEWVGFSSLLLDRRDGRIDAVIDESPEKVVAIRQGPGELKNEQLRVFGRESMIYDIVGQVAAGYLPLPRGREQGRCAVTIQAVRTLDNNLPRLRINVIGRIPRLGGADQARSDDLLDFLKLEPEPELEGHFGRARKKLEELDLKFRFSDPPGPARRKRLSASERAAAVRPVLTRLARGIESVFRRRRRRTRHAIERRAERPAVGMALKDLGKCHPDRVLFDELDRTFVVLGPKWRTHVFGRDGRHVTSMVLNRDGVRKRIDTRRWRYTTREEIDKIRTRAASAVPGRDRF